MVRHIFGISEHKAFALISRCSALVHGMKMPNLSVAPALTGKIGAVSNRL